MMMAIWLLRTKLNHQFIHKRVPSLSLTLLVLAIIIAAHQFMRLYMDSLLWSKRKRRKKPKSLKPMTKRKLNAPKKKLKTRRVFSARISNSKSSLPRRLSAWKAKKLTGSHLNRFLLNKLAVFFRRWASWMKMLLPNVPTSSCSKNCGI